MKINSEINKILIEIKKVLSGIDDFQVELVIKDILNAKTVILVGAGRFGMPARGFAMRLEG